MAVDGSRPAIDGSPADSQSEGLTIDDDRLTTLSRRVVVEHVRPEVDGGRFPIKRTVGEAVEVHADIFADGHDVVVAVLRDRAIGAEHAEEAEHAEVARALRYTRVKSMNPRSTSTR